MVCRGAFIKLLFSTRRLLWWLVTSVMFKRCHPVCSSGRLTAPRKRRASKEGRFCPRVSASALPVSCPAPAGITGLTGRAKHSPSVPSSPGGWGVAFSDERHSKPSQNLFVSDKWGAPRQKNPFNIFWWASYKVGFSAAKSIWSALFLNIFRKHTESQLVFEVTVYTHTHQRVWGGPAFVTVIIGFAPWTRNQDLFQQVCRVNRGFMNPTASYKIWFSKIYYEIIMKDLIWHYASSDWPAIFMDVPSFSWDIQSKWAGKRVGRTSQDSMATGMVMSDSI